MHHSFTVTSNSPVWNLGCCPKATGAEKISASIFWDQSLKPLYIRFHVVETKVRRDAKSKFGRSTTNFHVSSRFVKCSACTRIVRFETLEPAVWRDANSKFRRSTTNFLVSKRFVKCSACTRTVRLETLDPTVRRDTNSKFWTEYYKFSSIESIRKV
jgi:hypothetical protein